MVFLLNNVVEEDIKIVMDQQLMEDVRDSKLRKKVTGRLLEIGVGSFNAEQEQLLASAHQEREQIVMAIPKKFTATQKCKLTKDIAEMFFKLTLVILLSVHQDTLSLEEHHQENTMTPNIQTVINTQLG